MDDDVKLVEEVLNGNIDSFNIIVNKYEQMVLRFIYNILRDKEASEDITQEVFVAVYNKIYLYDKKYKFSNWVYQIAKNKSIDYIRKYKRVYEANVEDIQPIADKSLSPEQQIEYREMKQNIEEFIRKLNAIDKQILILRYSDENNTFSDIAQILNINESTVKRRYYKSREKYKLYDLEQEKRCK
jgi:RNA polymerase sigma-70 factor, ECF subfamily